MRRRIEEALHDMLMNGQGPNNTAMSRPIERPIYPLWRRKVLFLVSYVSVALAMGKMIPPTEGVMMRASEGERGSVRRLEERQP